MTFKSLILAGALVVGAAGTASAQMPASSPNSGVDKPSNSGIGMVQPPGTTSPGYGYGRRGIYVDSDGPATGSIVEVPDGYVPAVDPTYSQPFPTGSAGSSNTSPAAQPNW